MGRVADSSQGQSYLLPLTKRMLLFLVCCAVSLGLSGCLSTLGQVNDGRTGSISQVSTAYRPNLDTTTDMKLIRLQSPVDDVAADEFEMPIQVNPAEESRVSTSASVPAQTASASTYQDAPAAPPAISSGPAMSGLNPIRALTGMSATLRNRLLGSTGGNATDPQFNYPDIHSDPAQRYREQHGVQGDNDPFILPSIMNLIFEDRWLLAENDADKALKNQLGRRMKINIRDPDPDMANFPNGAYTLPKGRMYIESSPLGLYGASGNQPRTYQWEYLIRYGLTDNLEFRIFSNGLTSQAAQGDQASITGFSPLAIDFKANFWEENTKYHLPAMGIEVYLQTTFLGSSAFNSGTQPSMNLLFDQSLPFDIGFEYNVGISGVQNNLGQITYQFSYQWSLEREVVEDFSVFFHGFYNAAALPRISQFQTASQALIPSVTVVGFGGIWTMTDRLSMFGSFNFGLTTDSPKTICLLGFAVAL